MSSTKAQVGTTIRLHKDHAHTRFSELFCAFASVHRRRSGAFRFGVTGKDRGNVKTHAGRTGAETAKRHSAPLCKPRSLGHSVPRQGWRIEADKARRVSNH